VRCIGCLSVFCVGDRVGCTAPASPFRVSPFPPSAGRLSSPPQAAGFPAGGFHDRACLSRYDGLLHFRINNLGAWCLGQVDEYVATPFEERPVLEILPSMDVVATERLRPGDVLFLELFAEPTSGVAWAIRHERVLSALEEGITVDEMVAFLEAKSGSPLPEEIAVSLEGLGERISRLVVRGPGLLIEAQDAALAQRIANDSRTRSLCMLAGQRYLVIPRDAENAFRRALHEMRLGVSTPKE
jgi:hypothetical protein